MGGRGRCMPFYAIFNSDGWSQKGSGFERGQQLLPERVGINFISLLVYDAKLPKFIVLLHKAGVFQSKALDPKPIFFQILIKTRSKFLNFSIILNVDISRVLNGRRVRWPAHTFKDTFGGCPLQRFSRQENYYNMVAEVLLTKRFIVWSKQGLSFGWLWVFS